MKILRPINVAFTALIQILIYWCVIVPTLTMYGIAATTPTWVILSAIATETIANRLDSGEVGDDDRDMEDSDAESED